MQLIYGTNVLCCHPAMQSEYTIERFDKKKLPALKALFDPVFGVDAGMESYCKKYDTSRLGGASVSYVAIEKSSGRIVAHYAALPVRVTLDGETAVAAQSSDALTDADHRKKGLFKQLAERVHEDCRKAGIVLLFSQPNAGSVHSFLNVFRFQHIDDIVRWDLKLQVKTFPLARLLLRSRLHHLYVNYCKACLKKYTVPAPQSFTNTLAADSPRILRDKAYLEYKEGEDKFFIRIDEATLWIKLTDVLWIGEIDQYEKVTEITLKKLRKLAFALGYNTISFHLNAKQPKPSFLHFFKPYQKEPSTFFYFSEAYAGSNLILTGADFDIW